MRVVGMSAALIVLVITGAYAQQQRSCSGIKARCEQTCTGRKTMNCNTNCEAAYNGCMQTGEWRGGKNTFTNVERR
jgi:hypothetical protein